MSMGPPIPDGQIAFSAEDRRRNASRVRAAGERLRVVEEKLRTAAFEAGVLLREVAAIREEIEAALSGAAGEEE